MKGEEGKLEETPLGEDVLLGNTNTDEERIRSQRDIFNQKKKIESMCNEKMIILHIIKKVNSWYLTPRRCID